MMRARCVNSFEPTERALRARVASWPPGEVAGEDRERTGPAAGRTGMAINGAWGGSGTGRLPGE